LPNAECGLGKKNFKIRNPNSEIEGPMLPARSGLAPEPKPRRCRHFFKILN